MAGHEGFILIILCQCTQCLVWSQNSTETGNCPDMTESWCLVSKAANKQTNVGIIMHTFIHETVAD